MIIKKLLTLSVGGTPIETPGGLSNVSSAKAGPLGQNLISYALSLSLIMAVVLTLFFLIWGGISWITSGGDKHGLEQAKARITYAIIGLALTFLSFLIISAIGGIFGISLLGAPILLPREIT